MSEVRAALLAGGRGERLGALMQHKIKPLLPYAGTCRLVDFSLVNAWRSGVPEVVLMSGIRERELIDHVLRRWTHQPGFRVHLGPNEHLTANQAGRWDPDAWPLASRRPEHGTADALLTNEAYVFAAPVRDVLVQHCDHVYLYDYRPMLAAHRVEGADVTIGVQRIERRFVPLFGMVEVDPSGRVTTLVEKPAEPTSDLIFAAFALFRADVLRTTLHALDRLPAEDWQHDISRDVLPAMLAEGRLVQAYEVTGYWADIGTVERYHLGHKALLADPDLLPATGRPVTVGSGRLLAERASVRHIDSTFAGDVRASFGYPGSVVEAGAFVQGSVLLPRSRVRSGVTVRDSVVMEGEVLTADRIGLGELEAVQGTQVGVRRG